MAYHHHQQQPAYAQQPPPPPPPVVPDQAAYAAGYHAGYDAGYRAGVAAAAQGQAQQQGQQYASQGGFAAVNPQQLPYRPSAQGPPQAAAAAAAAPPQHSLPPAVPPRPAQGHNPPRAFPHPPAAPSPSDHPHPYPHPHILAPALGQPLPQSPIQSQTQPQIWQPAPNTTFNYVLSSPPPTTHPVFPLHRFDVWIVDLFDTPPETVRKIHEAGSRAVAYFSAGSWEDWRADKGDFLGGEGQEEKGKWKGIGKGRGKGDGGSAGGVLGKPLDGWKGERWVDVRDERVRDVMRRRLDLARDKGFDGVDPDNVDGYDNKNGLGLTRADAVAFVRWLAAEARSRGLACGLKNGAGFVGEVLGVVGWVVVEEAVRYKETEGYACAVRAGKPVWGVEYPKGEDEEDERCNDERRVEGRKRDEALKMTGKGWSCVIKNVRLDLWVQVD